MVCIWRFKVVKELGMIEKTMQEEAVQNVEEMIDGIIEELNAVIKEVEEIGHVQSVKIQTFLSELNAIDVMPPVAVVVNQVAETAEAETVEVETAEAAQAGALVVQIGVAKVVHNEEVVGSSMLGNLVRILDITTVKRTQRIHSMMTNARFVHGY